MELPFILLSVEVGWKYYALALTKWGKKKLDVKTERRPCCDNYNHHWFYLLSFFSHRKWRVWACFHPGARRCYLSFGFRWKESGDALWSTGESTTHVQVWHSYICTSSNCSPTFTAVIHSKYVKISYSSGFSVGTSIGQKSMQRQIIATASLMETWLLPMPVWSPTMGSTSVKQRTALGPSLVETLFYSLHVSRPLFYSFKHRQDLIILAIWYPLYRSVCLCWKNVHFILSE